MFQITAGFVVPKIQSIDLTDKDFEKYKISADDLKKVDSNKDGKITANEFLANGLSIQSVFQAYLAKAKSSGAYVEKANRTNGNNPQNQQANQTISQQKYNLNHPNVTSPIMANKVDYLA